MKKALIALLAVLMVLSFASCGKEKAPAAAAVKDHVATWDEFEEAMKDSSVATVTLDADITWNVQKYSGAEGLPFMIDFTGRTLDLNGHTISGIAQNALMLNGDSFTVKNGKLTCWPTNKRYALVLNWLETASVNDTNWEDLKSWGLAARPAKYDDSDPVWAKRIVIENMEMEGFGAAYVTVEMKNCKVLNAPYRALSMWGASGILENVECESKEGIQYGLAIVNWGDVTLKGTVKAVGSTSLYVADGARCICDDAADVTLVNTETSTANRTIYNYREGYVYLGAKTVVKSFDGMKPLNLGMSSYTEIAKGCQIAINGNASGEYTADTDWLTVSTVESFDYKGGIYDGQPADCAFAKVVDNR